MKLVEDYFDDYLDRYNILLKRNELWRLKLTPIQFIQKVEEIKLHGNEARKRGLLNEYHIERNEMGKISILLMDKLTWEEVMNDIDRLKKLKKEFIDEEALEIHKYLKGIRTPLDREIIRVIHSGLIHNQISLLSIPQHLLDEFIETEHFRIFLKRVLKVN